MPHNYFDFFYTRVQKDLGAIPKGVKTLIFGLFVFMIAWGIIDPFFSILLHQVMGNYSLTGLVYGSFFIVGALFSVPTGLLADKANKIRLTVFGILLYPFVGIFYLFSFFFPAGLAFIALLCARIFNGACALFWVMAESFIRKNSPKGETSATFGLYVTFQRLAFVIAPLAVIPLVLFFGLNFENLHWLLLALIPFSIIAAFIISRVKDSGEPFARGVRIVVAEGGIFKKEVEDLKSIGIMGYFCLLLAFFMRSLESIALFLIPLYALSMKLSLIEISLISAAISIPFLLSFFLAELSDRLGKANTICVGFAGSAITLLAIAFSGESHSVLFIAGFALGLLLAIIQPAVNGLLTDITPRISDGEMTGLYLAVIMISGFLSTVAIGLLSDLFSLTFPFIVLAIALFGLSFSMLALRQKIVVRI